MTNCTRILARLLLVLISVFVVLCGEGHVMSYTFHTPDLPRRVTQPSGKWKERVYNSRWQMISNIYSSASTPWVSVEPNVFGTAERVEDANGLIYHYGILPMGQLMTNEIVTSPWMSWTLQHGHDAHSRETGWELEVDGSPKGNVSYRYDTNGQICEAACTNTQGRGIVVAYTNLARFAYGYSVSLPSGSVFRWQIERDAYRRQLVTRQTYSFDGSPIRDYSYSYDALGRLSGRSEAGSSTADTFLYSPRREIVQADVQGLRFGYGFDSAGNCTGYSVGATTNHFLHNQLNQCMAYAFPSKHVTVPHRYDPDGSLTHVAGEEWYKWDCENRLVEVVTPDGIVTNTYDYEHHLVRQQLPGGVRLCVFDRWSLIYEKVVADGGTIIETEYFWGPDRSGRLDGACGVGGLVAVSRGGSFHLPCYGSNSEIVAYVSEQGEVVASYVYGPFGETVSASGSMAEAFAFRYMTKRADLAVGMYDFGGRWYLPALRRWINRDPLGEDGGLNLYMFCDNDPVNKYDPNGCIPLDTVWDLANVIYDICAGDDVALAADTAALCIPYVPAGATKLVKAAKLSRVKKIQPVARQLKVTYRYEKYGDKHFKLSSLPQPATSNWKRESWVRRTLDGHAQFRPGFTHADGERLTNAALQEAKARGLLRPDQLNGYIYNAGNNIGAYGGKPTSFIKLRVTPQGEIHIHPVVP